MDIMDAAHRVAHDYLDPVTREKGATALARRLGRNPGTFLNELNPAQEGHKLGVVDATAMQAAAGDARVLLAMAWQLGWTCFELPDMTEVSDQALLELVCEIQVESGRWADELNRALDDGRVSRDEMEGMEARAMLWIAAIARALNRLRDLM